MASYYGDWVATDDYRARLDVTTGIGDGKTTYDINAAVLIHSIYGYASWGVSANLKVNGSTKASVSDKSMPSGTTTTLISSTKTTIQRTHAVQKINVSGTVAAAGTPYYGASSTASTTVNVPAKASYAVGYNANGGTGEPSGQTKWHGEDLTLSSDQPTRAATVDATYTVTYSPNGGAISPTSSSTDTTSTYSFNGWNTKSDGSGTSYASGAKYSENSGATLYAQWTRTTKTAPITLPRPTRDNYSFDGWFNGSTKVGDAGDAYTPTGNITLTAHWTLLYQAPTISRLTATRCTSDGTASDDGTYCKLTIAWANGSETVTSCEWTVGTVTETTTGLSSVTTASTVLGTFSTESRFTVKAVLSDAVGTATATTVLSPSFFTMDFLAGGRGVAIGQPATKQAFEVSMPTEVHSTVTADGLTSTNGAQINGSVSISAAAQGDTFEVGIDTKLDAGFEQENGTVVLDATSKDAWLEALGLKDSGSYGTEQDISSYTSSTNRFTFPCDGFCKVICSYAANSWTRMYLYDADGNRVFEMQASAANNGNVGANHTGMPVFAGMSVYMEHNASVSGSSMRFIPRVNIGSSVITKQTYHVGDFQQTSGFVSLDDASKAAWLSALGLDAPYTQNYGNWVNLFCWGHIGILTVVKEITLNNSWASVDICTVPSQFKPSVDSYVTANWQNTTANNVTLHIDTNGLVQARVRGGTNPNATSFVSGTLIWMY